MIQPRTEKQENWYQEFSRFGEQVVTPQYPQRYQSRQFATDAWATLTERDFWKIPVPQTQGGLGGTWYDFSAALEGLASTAKDMGFLLSVIAQAGFLHGLLKVGTPDQQARWVPQLLAGAITATAIAEPQSGTDVPNVQTLAQPEGDQYRLSGEKWHIAHGNTATLALVVAKLVGTEGFSCFLVDHGQLGVACGAAFDTWGIRTLPIASIKYTEVALGSESLFGKPGKGLPALGAAVGLARVYYGWLGALLLRQALPQVWEFLAGRTSFGKPILKHQHVQQKLTEVKLLAEQAYWTAQGALSQLMNQHSEAVLMGSVAKLTGSQALVEGSQQLLSLLSSHGYQENHPMARLVQDALGLMSVGGTEETHRINLFNQMARLYQPKV